VSVREFGWAAGVATFADVDGGENAMGEGADEDEEDAPMDDRASVLPRADDGTDADVFVICIALANDTSLSVHACC